MRKKDKRDNSAEETTEDQVVEKDKAEKVVDGDQNVPDSNDSDEQTDTDAEETVDPRDQQIADLSDKFVRLMAEYDNFRKRSRQEKDALYEQSVTDVVGEWLTVIDNLERAMTISEKSENQEVKQFAEGLNLVMRQVEKSLATLKVSVINPLGETFDPNRHSAVLHIDDDQYQASEIVEVFEKGYERNGKIIRHAIVKVAN